MKPQSMTGQFWWTLEDITDRMANNPDFKEYFDIENIKNGFVAYETAIKGPPAEPDKPNACWAITNRYDPRIEHNENP